MLTIKGMPKTTLGFVFHNLLREVGDSLFWVGIVCSLLKIRAFFHRASSPVRTREVEVMNTESYYSLAGGETCCITF